MCGGVKGTEGKEVGEREKEKRKRKLSIKNMIEVEKKVRREGGKGERIYYNKEEEEERRRKENQTKERQIQCMYREMKIMNKEEVKEGERE